MRQPGRRRVLLRGLLTQIGLFTALVALGAPAAQVVSPSVQVEATIDPSARSISGVLTITLDPADPRAEAVLWFHLPPNRFLAPDPRGERRHLAPIPFAISYLASQLRDPLLPEGFSEGSIRIDRVQAADGTALPFELVDNPEIPVGFSARDGLLKVSLPPEHAATSVKVRFVTHLPHRAIDGWSETAWVLANWFPELARHGGLAWELGVYRPRPARYSARIKSAQSGWMATSRGEALWREIDQPLEVEDRAKPEKGLPLIFVPVANQFTKFRGDLPMVSLHPAEGGRVGELSLRIAHAFLGFANRDFGLPAPTPALLVVQADLPPEETLTLGNVLILSKDFNHQTPQLDRILVGAISQALGQVWFGEQVWIDEDRESWLRYGMSGYLALAFYESLYGADGRVHTITDWLNPLYREHFFESPVRGMMRDGEDAPLLLSLATHPKGWAARTVVHRKAPLVLRSLAFVLGEREFQTAVQSFFTAYQAREAGHGDLQRVVEQAKGESMAWFFDQWFRGTPQLDYAISLWDYEIQPNSVQVTIHVRRSGTGTMPLVVRVTAEDGSVRERRISGIHGEEVAVFEMSSPPASIQLDPDEYLLELDRRNNHSDNLYRVRPFFDWSRQREVLVSLRGKAGGNAVDGNYAGLGVNIQFNADHQVRLIPIYGEHTGWVNYDVAWEIDHFLHSRLTLVTSAEHIGGLRKRGVSLAYWHGTRDEYDVRTAVAARAEEVEDVHRTDGDRLRAQVAGDANNLEISHAAEFLWSSRWSNSLSLVAEHGQPSYGGDFDFTRLEGRLGQTIRFTPHHSIEVELVRMSAAGQTPLQKQPLLGDPLVLRGYPRSFRLVHEQLGAARWEYHWTVTRSVLGREVQTRRIDFILFQDIGKGWDNGQTLEDTPQRQNAGFGIEVDVNVSGFVTFPARVEVAMPYNDAEYKNARVIFFQALSFF